MRLMDKVVVGASLFTALVMPASVHAQVFNTAFGGAGFSCLNQDFGQGACDNPRAFIWTEGDYWRQSISGSGLSSINGLGLSLRMNSSLISPNSLNFDVLVNGIAVGVTGPLSYYDFDPFVTPLSFSFNSIAAADYLVEVRVRAPSIPDGGGALGLFYDGTSTIQLRNETTATVPEPVSGTLLLSGLAGLFGIAYRRRA